MEEYINDLNAKRTKAHDLADRYRGKILTSAIYVEDWLSTVITTYFTRGVDNKSRVEEKAKTHYLLIQKGGFDFYGKAELVKRIAQVEEVMSKKERSAFITDLQNLAEVRNKIAHWRISDFHPDTLKSDNDTVVFKQLSWKENSWFTELFYMDEEMMKNEIQKGEGVVEKLRELDKLFWGLKEGST